MYKGKIPFTLKGEPKDYVHPYEDLQGKVDWRDNAEFDATMKVVGIVRGRSAAHFRVQDVATGHEYTVFMTDMLGVMETLGVQSGATVPQARWVHCKRGTNYGIKLAT